MSVAKHQRDLSKLQYVANAKKIRFGINLAFIQGLGMLKQFKSFRKFCLKYKGMSPEEAEFLKALVERYSLSNLEAFKLPDFWLTAQYQQLDKYATMLFDECILTMNSDMKRGKAQEKLQHAENAISYCKLLSINLGLMIEILQIVEVIQHGQFEILHADIEQERKLLSGLIKTIKTYLPEKNYNNIPDEELIVETVKEETPETTIKFPDMDELFGHTQE